MNKRIDLDKAYFQYWVKYNVFSWCWWLMLILFIFLWFIWWRRVDKARLHEIVTYGTMVMVVAVLVDIVGCELVLWGYPTDLLPFIPPLFITDFCFLPVAYMLLYQYFPKWKPFIAASVILSAFIAFIAEEIAVILGIYEMNNWTHFYSYPMYVALAISLKGLMNRIIARQGKG